MTAKQKYNYEYLQQFCQDTSITLLKDYSNEKINRDAIIEGKCKTDKCNETFSKTFRDLTSYDAYCKKCAKKNRVIIRKEVENNIFEAIFNYKYLQKICKENGICLLKDYSQETINRDTEIEGQCKTDKCNETFSKTFRMLDNSNGYCETCTNNNRVKKLKETIQNNHRNISLDKSLSSHDASKWFSNKNIDSNGELISTDYICLGSHDKYWFNCDNCSHDFEISINKLNNQWCPYCRDSHNKFCDNQECKTCYENSISSIIKNKFYIIDDFNDKIIKISKKSHTKINLKCKNCDHNFSLQSNRIACGSGCPYCCNPPQQLCTDDDCKKCFNKSFASSPKCKYLDEPNINPRELCKASGKKFKFKCEFNHSFESTLCNIAFNRWCPLCVNKTEKKVYEKLKFIYPNLERQFKTKWCKNINCLPFDFVLGEYKLIIELDGPQHFIQISNWQSPEQTRERDKYKLQCANNNGYSIIRLLQEDVYYDTYDWFDELIKSIEKIKIELIIQNIYLCKNNEYSQMF